MNNLNIKDFFLKYKIYLVIVVGVVVVAGIGTAFLGTGSLGQGLLPEKVAPGTPDPKEKPKNNPPANPPSSSNSKKPTHTLDQGTSFNLSNLSTGSTSVNPNTGKSSAPDSSSNPVQNDGGLVGSSGQVQNNQPGTSTGNNSAGNSGTPVQSAQGSSASYFPSPSNGFSNLNIDPNPFVIRNQNIAVFSYTLKTGEGTMPVDAVIYSAKDPAKTPLKSWLQHQSSEGQNTLSWDGIGDNGKVVANGDYVFQTIYKHLNPDSVVNGIKVVQPATVYTKTFNFQIGATVSQYGSSSNGVPGNSGVPADGQASDPVLPEPNSGNQPADNSQSDNSSGNQSENSMDNVVEDSNVDNVQGLGDISAGDISDQNSGLGSLNNDGLQAPIVNIPVKENASAQTANSCAGFTDVPKNNPFCAAIDFVQKEKIMVGVSAKSFAPNEYVQRDQAAKIVAEAFHSHLPEVDYCQNDPKPYLDTEKDDWSVEYQCQAKAEKTITGYLAGEFKGRFLPAKFVSRAEMTAMLIRKVLKLNEQEKLPVDVTKNYADVGRGVWFSRFAAYAYKFDLFPKPKFSGPQFMTRAEVASLIYKLNQLGKIR